MSLRSQPSTERVEDADWLQLTDGEEIRWLGRPSRYTIALSLVGGALLVLVGIGLTYWLHPFTVADTTVVGFLPLLISVLGLTWILFSYLNWLRLLYVITDEEIYVKYGLVSRDVTQVPLNRIQNTSYQQSVSERLLDYGDIHIYTAGTGTEDITFRSVPSPESVKSELAEILSSRDRVDVEDGGLD